LLGGAFTIDASRARSSIETLARRLGAGVEATADGIVRLIDDAMAKVLRIVTVERGLDPRDFVLVAFGGGGPLHVCALADELDIRRVLIPAHPGLFSAHGLLDAELHHNEVRPVLRATTEVDPAVLEDFFGGSESRAREELLAQGADAATIAFTRQYDARYRGQSFELTIQHDGAPESIAQRFHQAHRARYDYEVPDEIVEVVSARLTARAKVARDARTAPSAMLREDAKHRSRRAKVHRRVWVDGAFIDAPVFARASLVDGQRIDGPAIVEEYDSTTFLAPRWSLNSEDDLLVLQKRPR
jgi:N-methylhydantoinase A